MCDGGTDRQRLDWPPSVSNYPTDSSRSPAAWSCCSVCVVGCCVVRAIGRSLMAAKGTRTPESTNPNQPRTGLIQIRRCSVFGSSKGGRAGGEKDLDWSIEGAIQQNNDREEVIAGDDSSVAMRDRM